MATAKTTEEVYEIECLIISAARSILTKAGFSNPLLPGDSKEIPDDFTAIRCGLGDVTGIEGVRVVEGRAVSDYAGYKVALEIDLGVERGENVLVGGLNGAGVSRVMDKKMARLRVCFLNHPPPFAAFLPFWQVVAITPRAAQYDLRKDREIDFATLGWDLEIRLMADALPPV